MNKKSIYTQSHVKRVSIHSTIIAVLVMIGCAEPPTETKNRPYIETRISQPALSKEPIAFIGHGAVFDATGNEVTVTPEFIEQAQDIYIRTLTEMLTNAEKRKFLAEQDRYSKWLLKDKQEKLIINAALIDWLVFELALDDAGALQGKNNLLRSKLKNRLFEPNIGTPYKIPKNLRDLFPDPGDFIVKSATGNGDAEYIAECLAAGVPTPPDWGDEDWKATGQLSNSEEFISSTYIARPYVFRSMAPEGSCIALPRVNEAETENFLLGIICLGKVSGKACFWDNQDASGNVSPILFTPEKPETGSRLLSEFIGGADLFEGAGGVCTGCHAGENPFNIHPGTALGHPALDMFGTLVTTADVWHDPLVHADWPQNEFMSTLAAQPEASQCQACHSSSSNGGRFPKLSTALVRDAAGNPGYCLSVLKNAINIAPSNPDNTMPQGGILSSADHTALVTVINDFCDGDPANAEGDPHLHTTDSINYDFQATGEFVLLKGVNDFEVQTRQNAIPTTFFPGPNAYTGLATCVSVNEAVAAQVGKHRVSFQPRLDGVPDPTGMELRIDGVLTPLTDAGVTLPTGGRVARSAVDGMEIEFPNGEFMTATPGFWNSQGKWYVNVNIFGAEANDGIIGSISPRGWLPALPDGSSMGPKPASVMQRYNDLNHTFADAWRVKKTNSLFDYLPSGSPTDFVLPGWPKDTPDCDIPQQTPAKPADRRIADSACQGLTNKNRFENCVFDVALTGEAGFAKTYLRTEKLERWGTSTQVTVNASLGKDGKQYGFVAKVRPRWRGLNRAATGRIQFFLNGKLVGKQVLLDRTGRAIWAPRNFKWQKYRVSARYAPAQDSSYLESTSPEIIN